MPAGWEQLSRFLWLRRTTLPNPLTRARSLPLLTSELDDSRLLFLDTETTGLSGGAGTIAFLVGIGASLGADFEIRQYFVTDYPGEPELIAALAKEINEAHTIVSYNGKSFDLPILRSRFALNGRRLPPVGQIDLLHPARRLWKRSIGACSLHAIEEQVLKVERSEDVPGFMVPELYFDYLKDGDPAPLQGVFSHHLYDIHSLATLLDFIETLPGRNLGEARVDSDELGRIMLERGLPGGLELLSERTRGGSLDAARIASLYLKRRGRWQEAVEIWRFIWERSRSYFGGVELAKYYEHRTRELEEALRIVEGLSELPLRGTPWAKTAREDIARRRERIRAKIARRAGR